MPSILYASEVYYVGHSIFGTQFAPNPSYSLSKRLHDLLDFSDFGQYGPERSGMLSGNFMQEFDWNRIGGNKSRSFLPPGPRYLSELHLTLQEKLPLDYDLEGLVFLRLTDNPHIDARRDLHAQQFNFKVLNATNMVEVGNFYGDFSQFVLGSNLQGLNMEVVPQDSVIKGKFIAGRSVLPDEAANKFQRNVVGGKLDFSPFPKSDLFSVFRIGSQILTSDDDSSSIASETPTVDLHNTVGSIDGDIDFKKYATFNFEVARSAAIIDKNVLNEYKYGTALRLQPGLDFGKFKVRYLYYYVQPKFYTDIGSAAWDKEQHQVTADYCINQRVALSATENYYWNHLNGSSQAMRTINDQKDFSINLTPLAARPSFTIRPYVDYLQTNSDDPIDSLESVTRSFGFSTNDRLGPSINYGITYEIRAFIDKADQTQTLYGNRAGFNISQEEKFFGRRLYYTFQPGVDISVKKGNGGKADANFTWSATVQYNLLDNLLFNTGYNVQLDNSPLPNANSFTTGSFAELDFTVSKLRSTHLVIRFEKNRYVNQDGSQSYKETRGIAKFVSNF